MVYVKRRDTFHVDSSNDLYGEARVTFDCTLLDLYFYAYIFLLYCVVFIISKDPISCNPQHTLFSVSPAISDFVQLLCGPIWLQPLPYSWQEVWLCVVWHCSGQLPVFRLLQWTCTAHMSCPSPPFCEYRPHLPVYSSCFQTCTEQIISWCSAEGVLSGNATNISGECPNEQMW